MSPIAPKAKVKQEDVDKLSPKQKESDKPIVYQSFVELGDILAEQVYKDGKSFYITYNYEIRHFEEKDEIEGKNNIYKPLQAGNLIEKRVLLFPTGIKGYGSTKELKHDIIEFAKKYWEPTNEFLFAIGFKLHFLQLRGG